MRVLKFGGTSLAHPQRLDVVAGRVLELRREGPVVVVVSALGGVTDELAAALDAARRGEPSPGLVRRLRAQHLEDPDGRLDEGARHRLGEQLDLWLRRLDGLLDGVARLGEAPAGAVHRVLATGERLAAPRVAAWLAAAGAPAAVVDGTSLLRADHDLAEGGIRPPRLDAAATRRSVLAGLGGLVRGEVPVVTGFIGGDRKGRTVTLGRGASDLSATTLAAALEADGVEIWSDTDGVLSADPRRVPSAVPLRRLSFAEASSLARYGAKVLHPDTLEPVRRASLPVHLRSTFRPEAAGTRLGGSPPTSPSAGIDPQTDHETHTEVADRRAHGTVAPALAASRLDVVRLTLRSAPSIPLASQVLAVLERAEVAPLTLAAGRGRLELWLREADAGAVASELGRTLRALGGGLDTLGDKAAIALLPSAGAESGGEDTAPAPALAGRLADCLAARGLAVAALFTDRAVEGGAIGDEPGGPELAVAVVDRAVADLALRAAHDALVVPAPAADRLVAAAGG